MKDIKAQQSDILCALSMKIIAGETTFPNLLHHGCVNTDVLADLLNTEYENAALPPVCRVFGLARSPHLYPRVVKLKYKLQGIDGDTHKRYAKEVTEASVLAQIGEHNKGWNLIQARVAPEHQAYVAIRAEVKAPAPDYWLMSDAQLMSEAAGFESVSLMKYFYPYLHAHLHGRGLQNEALKDKPDAYDVGYIDAKGNRYFTYAELVAANYLRLNKIEYHAQYKVPSDNDGKVTLQADFFVPETNLVIELIHPRSVGDATRQTRFEQRVSDKMARYESAGYEVLMVETGSYFQETGFDIAGFAFALQSELEKAGVKTSNSFSAAELGYIENKAHRILNCIPIDELLSFLKHQGVVGMDSLKGPFRFYLDAIQRRSDIAAILQHFEVMDEYSALGAGAPAATVAASQ